MSYEVPRAKAIFHPTVGSSFLASGEKLRPELGPAVDTNTQSASAFISQLVPTGATVIVSNDFTRQETEQEDPPRTFESAVTVSVVQPLLRGGWLTVTTQPIRDAEFGVRIEEARLRAEILRIVAQAKSNYYTAILAEKIIAITEEAIQRDKTLIESSQALFQAGLVTKRDVFSAEVILSKDLARLANAQADLAVAKNALLDVLGISIATEVDLLDKDLSFQPILLEPELARWIAAAISHRPEVLEVEERLGQSELNIRVARNTTLPQLDLVALTGRSHTASTFGRSLESPWRYVECRAGRFRANWQCGSKVCPDPGRDRTEAYPAGAGAGPAPDRIASPGCRDQAPQKCGAHASAQSLVSNRPRASWKSPRRGSHWGRLTTSTSPTPNRISWRRRRTC